MAAEVGLARTRREVVPGEELVLAPQAMGVEGGVQGGFRKRSVPPAVVEDLVPTVESGSGSPGGLDDRSQAAVATSENGFQHGTLDVVGLDSNG
jgi:hypothetical protein